ncbi:hypothetical protein AMATHDRAFT_5017 [Amanita thiersii Skay4041]|uniref:Uncharacterized protein n=1 Tax=Amanita thiersii Skay4041 TaxID=703135 RepID=A0A2A9NE74_9AGAR|nr:hypothetical protein AMATHDRAFT_5017 [Amanita thiersii Skay4041]
MASGGHHSPNGQTVNYGPSNNYQQNPQIQELKGSQGGGGHLRRNLQSKKCPNRLRMNPQLVHRRVQVLNVCDTLGVNLNEILNQECDKNNVSGLPIYFHQTHPPAPLSLVHLFQLISQSPYPSKQLTKTRVSQSLASTISSKAILLHGDHTNATSQHIKAERASSGAPWEVSDHTTASPQATPSTAARAGSACDNPPEKRTTPAPTLLPGWEWLAYQPLALQVKQQADRTKYLRSRTSPAPGTISSKNHPSRPQP